MTLEELNNNYVNIHKLSENELGRKLTMGYYSPFKTSFGTFNNIRSGLEYMFIDGYPERLLSKKKLSKKDIKSIPKLKKEIPNYWAAVAHMFISRMDNEPETISLIRENELQFVAYSVTVKEDPYLGKINKINKNHKLNTYVKIVNKYSDIIKSNLSSDKYKKACVELINSFKRLPDKFIYEGNVRNLKLDK